jgi:outer membrane autotransporter protein
MFFNYNGFQESGGPTGSDLSVDGRGVSYLRSSLGAAMRWSAKIGPWTVQPEVSAAWFREYLDQNDVTAHFVAVDGSATSFTVDSGLGQEDGIDFGVGLGARLGRSIRARLHYDGEWAPHDLNHTLSLGVTIAF